MTNVGSNLFTKSFKKSYQDLADSLAELNLSGDFGDLDQLTLSLDHDGAAARVFLIP